jgi:thiosulfate/3-mercaptopyruvate sulfurtransferase
MSMVTKYQWDWRGRSAIAAALLLMATVVHSAGQTSSDGYGNPTLLILPEQVSIHQGDRNWHLVDVRAPEQYAAGHIPGAANLSIATLTQTVHGTPGMLAPLTVVTQALGEHGISPESRVVIYDDYGGLRATRLFWILDYLGHGQVSVLQGGFRAWQRQGYAVNQEVPERQPTTYQASPNSEKLANMGWIVMRLKDPNTVLLDARSPSEFSGQVPGHHIERPGRIPGAVNVDWVHNLTTTVPRRFKAAVELRQLYEQAGVTADKEIVVYCRTGMRASHAYFVLRLLGYPRVKVYDGSFVEWSADITLPVEH